MSAKTQTDFTSYDYLVWERQQTCRHEYVNGDVFAMAGASRKHNLINGNIFAALHTQLRDKPCEIYNNDMRVKINAAGAYTYPDIVAVCGPPMFEDAAVDTLLNPVLVIEILSESTERYDRGAKFSYYRTLSSLQEYILVAQDIYQVEQYNRCYDASWLFTDHHHPNDKITLASIGGVLQMQTIYERVNWHKKY